MMAANTIRIICGPVPEGDVYFVSLEPTLAPPPVGVPPCDVCRAPSVTWEATRAPLCAEHAPRCRVCDGVGAIPTPSEPGEPLLCDACYSHPDRRGLEIVPRRAEPPRPASVSPGPCLRCGVERRERGEVRIHVWRCGCPVVGSTLPVWVSRGECVGAVLPGDEPGRHDVPAGAEIWYETRGHDVTGPVHPTPDGSVAAWRAALERRQVDDDRVVGSRR